jgi:hypothetical protein
MLYDVHVFTVVRVKVPGVVASSMREAIDKAELCIDWHRLFNSSAEDSPIDVPPGVSMEHGEEHSHFLVDQPGDDIFSESRWFNGNYEETSASAV